jgi:hypothetical protein
MVSEINQTQKDKYSNVFSRFSWNLEKKIMKGEGGLFRKRKGIERAGGQGRSVDNKGVTMIKAHSMHV